MNKVVLEDLTDIVNSPVNWNMFNNKTVLITGANGFLPAYLVYTLLHLNETAPEIKVTVLALVRNKAKADVKFAAYLNNPFLEIIEQDVCDPLVIDRPIDYIIHAASQASPKYYGTDPVGTLKPNVTGTINMLELARVHNVSSFLYFSSAEVYGQADNASNPLKESYYGYLDPTTVRACYAEAKRMGENICISYHHQYSVKAKIVRPFHTYGPGMDLHDGRVYADFVADALANRDIKMKSDGLAKRAFCYLTDATVGFFTVLLNGQDGQAYNVGNPNEEHSIIELAHIVAGLPQKTLNVIKAPAVEGNHYLKSTVNRYSPDISKIKSLGWTPVVTVAAGFTRTINSYKELY